MQKSDLGWGANLVPGKSVVATVLGLAVIAGLALPGCGGPHRSRVLSEEDFIVQYLQRDGLTVDKSSLFGIPVGSAWFTNCLVFACSNTVRTGASNPELLAVFVTGAGNPPVAHNWPDNPKRLAPTIEEAFGSLLQNRFMRWNPRRVLQMSSTQALDIAVTYAWMTALCSPDNLAVLQDSNDMATAFAPIKGLDAAAKATVIAQTVPPSIVEHTEVSRDSPVFAVEFYSSAPGDNIDFWHVEVGPEVFSASRRPIHSRSNSLAQKPLPKSSKTVSDVSAAKDLLRQQLGVERSMLVELSTAGTWLSNDWLFTRHNPAHRGGLEPPEPSSLFLVGRSGEIAYNWGDNRRNPTPGFHQPFTRRLADAPPGDATQALAIATAYAWFSVPSRPDRMQVLQGTNGLDAILERIMPLKHLAPEYRERVTRSREQIASQVTVPRIVEHRSPDSTVTPVYTVEFCTYSPDSWGDIYFWHIEVGRHVLSVSRRPIYLPARVWS